MSQNTLTLEQFREMINRCAGVKLTTEDLTRDPKVSFADLDVDSLGVLGVATELELLLDISLDEAEANETPADLLHAVFTRLIAAGRITPGHTEASIVVNALRPDVWRITNDVPAWPRLFSEYAEAAVLEEEGRTVTFRLTTHPDANGDSWSWVSQRTADQDTYTVEAFRVETGAFDFMRIHWSYDVTDGGTRMRWVQDFAMKPDAPVTTAWMTAYICANSLLQQARIAALIEAQVGAGALAA